MSDDLKMPRPASTSSDRGYSSVDGFAHAMSDCPKGLPPANPYSNGGYHHVGDVSSQNSEYELVDCSSEFSVSKQCIESLYASDSENSGSEHPNGFEPPKSGISHSENTDEPHALRSERKIFGEVNIGTTPQNHG
jgi:hypothetical protein